MNFLEKSCPSVSGRRSSADSVLPECNGCFLFQPSRQVRKTYGMFTLNAIWLKMHSSLGPSFTGRKGSFWYCSHLTTWLVCPAGKGSGHPSLWKWFADTSNSYLPCWAGSANLSIIRLVSEFMCCCQADSLLENRNSVDSFCQHVERLWESHMKALNLLL